jgi:hypothetical protein
VTGRQVNGLASWVTSEEFQVYIPLASDTAVLNFAAPDTLLAAYAADCARMAAAAVETLDGITPSTALPKSIGWILIQSYYSAFFSAHAVLRMFGRTCTQFDAGQITSIHGVADVYGTRAGISLTRGQYGGVIDSVAKTIVLRKRSGVDGGSHGAMWGLFLELIRDLTTKILAAPSTTAAQQVATKLIELDAALTWAGAGNGTWLSQMRNRTNYQMAFGAWFPYTERVKYYDSLTPATELWRSDPMKIQVWGARGRDLQKFLEASMLIVAICRVLCQDMSVRCPKGKSFQQFGPLALLARVLP